MTGLELFDDEPDVIADRPPVPGGDVPEIRIGPDLHSQVLQAESALAANAAEFYQRTGAIVHIIHDGRRKLRGFKRAPNAPTIQAVPAPYVKVVLSRAAEWVRFKGDEWVPAVPPEPVVQGLVGKGQWDLPHLEGVVEIPTLRPDGSVLQTPGYDEQTGIYFEPLRGRRFLDVPDKPTIDEATLSYEALTEWLCDFPFTTPAAKSAAVAAILTGLGRNAIPGPTPMFAIRAPVPGAGKGKLGACIARTATGREPGVMAPPTDNESTSKLLLTVAIEGHNVVLIDNVEGALGSPPLAAALTATEWRGRVLGVSRTATAPLRPLWMCTGNNISFRGDLGRRVIPIDIDPQVENPEERTGFRYELPAHVEQNLPELVAHGLTILRAHAVAGRPRHGGSRMGSFEDWDDVIRSPLLWLGVADPCADREKIRADSDADLERIRVFYATWHDVLGPEPKTVGQAIRAADNDSDLYDALAPFNSKGPHLDARSIGNRFRTIRGRIVGGFRLVKAGTDHRAIQWTVERLTTDVEQ